MSLDDILTAPPSGPAWEVGRDEQRFGRNAEPFILLHLLGGRSYGYEIRGVLERLGFKRATRDPGVVYRLLRNLEAAGFIASEWEAPGTGPARRYYWLTPNGEHRLREHARHLARQARRIQHFFDTYRSLGGEVGE